MPPKMQLEAEQQRSLRLRLPFQPQRNLDVGLARGLGVDVDLDVKRRLLPRRRERTGRVGIFERQVLHVLGEHANLRHHRLRLWTVRRCHARLRPDPLLRLG